jgi:hypothetical protein
VITLKPKLCEGYDRIPLRVLCDARDILLPSLTILFQKVTIKTKFQTNGESQESYPSIRKEAKIILKITGL